MRLNDIVTWSGAVKNLIAAYNSVSLHDFAENFTIDTDEKF